MNRLAEVLDSPGPHIAVSVAESLKIAEVEQTSQLVDVAELRADKFPWKGIKPLEAEIDKLAALPLLLTVRSAKEGGSWLMSEPGRSEVFGSLLPKVDGIDVELSAVTIAEGIVKGAHDLGKVAIVSSHTFDRVPSAVELDRQLEAAHKLGADYIKFAVTPQDLDDFQFLAEYTLSRRDEDLITVAMSKPQPEESDLSLVRNEVDFGKLSRLVMPYIGSNLVYGYAGDKPVAPGQMHYTELAALHNRFLYKN